ncbi:hypothetical protein OKW49_006657 [Paraburkholderia youngii]
MGCALFAAERRDPFSGGRKAMSIQEYAPYRGCNIEVNVTLSKTHWLGGKYRRYRVSWTVTLPGNPHQEVVSFPEQFDFLTEREAFRYGENRAHTYIDSILSTPSQRRGLRAMTFDGSSRRAPFC